MLYIAFALLLILPFTLVILLFSATSNMLRKLLFSSLTIALSLLLVTFVLVAWFFRDGLGPKSVESHGLTAWSRTLEGSWPVLMFILVIMAAGYFANRRVLREIQNKRR